MKEQTVTFEEIMPAMLKWAYYFANHRFDPWELINSAWAYGKVRFLPKSKVKLASKRIKYDMIDYMRNRDGLKARRHAEKTGNPLPAIGNFSELEAITNAKTPIADSLPAKTTLIDDIATKDVLDFLTNRPSLSRTDKLILKLYFIKGFTMLEIAEIIGVSESRVSQIRKNLLERLKALNYSKIA